jgi:5-methylcytosine-specific restriction endonuclease McrA
MWTLKKPETEDSAALLQRALSRDRGLPPYNLTEDEVAVAVTRYDQYDGKLGLAHPDLLTSVHGAELEQAIHNAYLQVQEGARLQEFRQRLILAAPLCPYCGSPAVTDLDHYLPRSKYRDFSIYGANLIPSCHPCNNVKRAFAPEDEAELSLVHPYFDKFPEEPLLEVEATIAENGGLVSTLLVPNPDGASDADLRARAQFQIEKFELNARLVEAINVFLSDFETAIEEMYEVGGPEKVADFLQRTAIRKAKRLGLNDWRPRLLHALADNDQFCDGGFRQALGNLSFGEGLA